MKIVQIRHFTKNGENVFTEKWTLRTPLAGVYKKDKARLKFLVLKDAHRAASANLKTKTYVITWKAGVDSYSFLLENI